jgi:hypothetical protein
MAGGLWKMAEMCLFYPSALSHLPSGRPFSAACWCISKARDDEGQLFDVKEKSRR